MVFLITKYEDSVPNTQYRSYCTYYADAKREAYEAAKEQNKTGAPLNVIVDNRDAPAGSPLFVVQWEYSSHMLSLNRR